MIYEISSYTYDWPHTDMNCCFSTVHTYYNSDTNTIGIWDDKDADDKPQGEWYTGNLIPMDVAEKIIEVHRENYKKSCEQKKVRFIEEANAYNAARLPQKKGQIVVIQNGRYKGLIGRISWVGKNKFKHDYGSPWFSVEAKMILQIIDHSSPVPKPCQDFDLICIRPVDFEGYEWNCKKDKIYIDPMRCKVLDGFEKFTVTDEMCAYQVDFDSSLVKNWRMGYNSCNYMPDMKKAM